MAADHRTLQALAEEGRVQELLRVVSFDTVIETWLRYHRTDHEPDDPDYDRDDDPDWWAVELWFSPAWWSDEGRVRDGLLRLIETAGEEELGVVAVGRNRRRTVVATAPDHPRLQFEGPHHTLTSPLIPRPWHARHHR